MHPLGVQPVPQLDQLDLAHTFAAAIDAHCLAAIAAANPVSGGAGADFPTEVLCAAGAIMAQGYSPNVVVASPLDLIDGLVLAVHIIDARLETFEENGGQTNTTRVHLEANGEFIVQRVGAIAEAVVGSKRPPYGRRCTAGVGAAGLVHVLRHRCEHSRPDRVVRFPPEAGRKRTESLSDAPVSTRRGPSTSPPAFRSRYRYS